VLTLVAIIGEIGSPFDMKKNALLGMAQGKKNGFKDYAEPSKVRLSLNCQGYANL